MCGLCTTPRVSHSAAVRSPTRCTRHSLRKVRPSPGMRCEAVSSAVAWNHRTLPRATGGRNTGCRDACSRAPKTTRRRGQERGAHGRLALGRFVFCRTGQTALPKTVGVDDEDDSHSAGPRRSLGRTHLPLGTLVQGEAGAARALSIENHGSLQRAVTHCELAVVVS